MMKWCLSIPAAIHLLDTSEFSPVRRIVFHQRNKIGTKKLRAVCGGTAMDTQPIDPRRFDQVLLSQSYNTRQQE